MEGGRRVCVWRCGGCKTRFSKDGEGLGDCKKSHAAWIFFNVVGEWRYIVYYLTEKR
jgi:hypothetical protein